MVTESLVLQKQNEVLQTCVHIIWNMIDVIPDQVRTFFIKIKMYLEQWLNVQTND